MSAEVLACAQCGRRNRSPAAARGGLRRPQCKAALPWLVDVGDADWQQQVVTASPLPVDKARFLASYEEERLLDLTEWARRKYRYSEETKALAQEIRRLR